MRFTQYLLALLVAVGSQGAWAQAINTYDTAEFVQLPGGQGIELLGFGRGGSDLREAPAALAPSGAAQPAFVAREPFFDTWNVQTDAVAPGEYSFDALIVDTTGSLLFDFITFNSYDASPVPVLHSVLFDINALRTQAVGSGTFTVRSECPVASCVFIQVFGTQDVGDSSAGYGGTTIAAVVPEPANWALLALGLAVIGGAARRARA